MPIAATFSDYVVADDCMSSRAISVATTKGFDKILEPDSNRVAMLLFVGGTSSIPGFISSENGALVIDSYGDSGAGSRADVFKVTKESLPAIVGPIYIRTHNVNGFAVILEGSCKDKQL
jgi:hypothetical protein